MPGNPFIMASQCSISASDAGMRDWRIGDGSSTMDLSSWRRRLVEGGVEEREVAIGGADGGWSRRRLVYKFKIDGRCILDTISLQ